MEGSAHAQLVEAGKERLRIIGAALAADGIV